MGWKGAVRASEAAHRRKARDEVKRLRELERQAKSQAKLSVLDQARLEVETHNSRIELLLSIHKEPIEVWNWLELIAALDPCPPSKQSLNELRERLAACSEGRATEARTTESQRSEDLRAFEQALTEHAADLERCRRHRELAGGVVRADLDAWSKALAVWRPFDELEELGVKVACEFQSRTSVHCRITVSGPEIIPQETKTLTSTGKLSTKAMPKTRFHEIYQDYVSGCVLRTATEMFGFLPLDVVCVTAAVGFVDSATGQFDIRPVLSVGFTRATFSTLLLDQVDPSDAIEGFVHRGDAKASRKTGTFVAVEPLDLRDMRASQRGSARFDDVLLQLRCEQEEIRKLLTKLAAPLRTTTKTSSTEA